VAVKIHAFILKEESLPPGDEQALQWIQQNGTIGAEGYEVEFLCKLSMQNVSESLAKRMAG
jgi:hypothetical protein